MTPLFDSSSLLVSSLFALKKGNHRDYFQNKTRHDPDYLCLHALSVFASVSARACGCAKRSHFFSRIFFFLENTKSCLGFYPQKSDSNWKRKKREEKGHFLSNFDDDDAGDDDENFDDDAGDDGRDDATATKESAVVVATKRPPPPSDFQSRKLQRRPKSSRRKSNEK